jgi:hypothetical protein
MAKTVSMLGGFVTIKCEELLIYVCFHFMTMHNKKAFKLNEIYILGFFFFFLFASIYVQLSFIKSSFY